MSSHNTKPRHVSHHRPPMSRSPPCRRTRPPGGAPTNATIVVRKEPSLRSAKSSPASARPRQANDGQANDRHANDGHASDRPNLRAMAETVGGSATDIDKEHL